MKLIHIASRSMEGTPSPAPEICVLLGQVLILLTAVLVAVMPVTEYLWSFDKFLRGGQDCEFGLLALAAVFCLVLVLSHQRRATLTLILSLQRILSSLFQRGGPTGLSSSLVTPMQYFLPHSASPLAINLPLQI